MDAIVRRKLREGRRRLICRDFLESGVWILLAGLIGLFCVRAAPAVFLDDLLGLWLAAGVFGAAILMGIFVASWRWRSLRDVACELDAIALTKDRFLTVLELDGDASAEISAAVRREAEGYFSGLRLDRVRPVPPGRQVYLLLLPLLGLAALEGMRSWRAMHPPEGLEDAVAMIAEARRAAEERTPEDRDMEKVAEELAQAEARLKESTDPMREALRALADLERRLAAASDANAPLDAAGAADLAEALNAQHPSLAEALRSGDNAAAAREVAAMDPADLAKALEQAARHRENQQLRELAELTAGSAQARLRQMLDPSDGDGRDGKRGRFLSALRDIKNGTSRPSPQDTAGNGEQPGESPDGDEKPAPGRADNAPPGGAPGSERDLGRGTDLAGESDPKNLPSSVDEFVAGTHGDGDAMIKMLRASGGDDPEALRAYRSAYETAAPAAIDAVNQEDIPAGSRILVRKYFEAIRPKD